METRPSGAPRAGPPLVGSKEVASDVYYPPAVRLTAGLLFLH